MRIKINRFSGEMPGINQSLLPDNAAVSAINCRISSGALQPQYGMDRMGRLR